MGYMNRFEELDTISIVLRKIEQTLEDRKTASVDKSYVASLYAKGLDAILKKIGEESVEVVMAAKDGDRDRIIYEVADLWFHTLILLRSQDINLKKMIGGLARHYCYRPEYRFFDMSEEEKAPYVCRPFHESLPFSISRVLKGTEQAIEDRKTASVYKSYVASLYAEGLDAILKKIGLASAKVIMAAKDEDKDRITQGVADLWVNTLILLNSQDINIELIIWELGERQEYSYLEENKLMEQEVKDLNPNHYCTRSELDFIYSRIYRHDICESERTRLAEKANSIYDAANLDWSNLDDIDKFIFDNRKYSLNDEFSLLYRRIVERAAKEAVLNSHKSLTETLILTLKKKAMDYPELLGYALLIATRNKQMKRTLYNTLRECIDEVNDYRGERNAW